MVILYRYFYGNKNNETINIIEKIADNNSVLKQKDKKELELFFLNKDPFLGKLIIEKKIKNIKIKKKNQVKAKSKRHSWPIIKYLGSIKKENGDQLALLNVRGSFVKMKKGEQIINYQFYVFKIYKDSVLLKQENEKRIIKK
jgi:hypothetical protein